MPAIDVETLLVTGVLLHSAAVALLWSVWRDCRDEPAGANWVAAAGAIVVGLVLLLLRPNPAPFWSIALHNVAIQLGVGLFLRGALLFDGHRAPPWTACVGAASFIATLAVPSIADDVGARVVVAAGLLAAHATALAAVFFLGRRNDPLPSRLPLAAIAFTAVPMQLFRIHVTLTQPMAVFEINRGTWIGPVGVLLLFESIGVPVLAAMLLRERVAARHRLVSRIDPLSGILNRRAFVAEAEARLAAVRSAVLVLFDIDRFKRINDTWGHAAGDRVISAFAGLVAARLGERDVFGRWGGEEFALLLVDADLGAARAFAEEIRRGFAESEHGQPGASIRATVSIGAAATGLVGTDLDRLLAAADAGLYAAKRLGRDRIEVRSLAEAEDPPAVVVAAAVAHRPGFGV